MTLGHGFGLRADALVVGQGAAVIDAAADFEAWSWRGGGAMAGKAVASVFFWRAVGAANGIRGRNWREGTAGRDDAVGGLREGGVRQACGRRIDHGVVGNGDATQEPIVDKYLQDQRWGTPCP